MSKITARRQHADEVMHEVIKHVSRCTQVTELAIKGRSRVSRLVLARHKAMAIGRQRGLRYSQIARVMGVNHTTVMHACKKMGVA